MMKPEVSLSSMDLTPGDHVDVEKIYSGKSYPNLSIITKLS